MAAVVATAKANNEEVTQTITDVTGLQLSTGEGISRPMPNGASWTKLIVAFRITTLGGPTAGNLGATKFFAGVCSSGAGRGTAGEHCVGWEMVNSAPIAYSDAFFTPALVVWFTGSGAIDGTHRRSGVQTSSCQINRDIHFVRNETAVTTPPSNQAHSWPGYVMMIEKGTPWVLGASDCQFVWPYNTPNRLFMAAGEQGGTFATAWPRIDNVWSKFSGASITTSQANLGDPQPDEATYGTLDRVNFWWECATSGVKLLIKDIQIMQWGA